MKPLLVLVGSAALSAFIIKLVTGTTDLALASRIGMSVMLLFTAAAHFAFTKGMAMMIPGPIPYKEQLVYFTGVLELAAAAGLLTAGLRRPTAWLLIVFFIMVLSANIYASARHVDYQKANFEGKGMEYLWFRIPLQILFILWVYFSSIIP